MLLVTSHQNFVFEKRLIPPEIFNKIIVDCLFQKCSSSSREVYLYLEHLRTE